MKKIYTLIAAVAVTFSATAQNKAMGTTDGSHAINKSIKVMPLSNSTRAIGDTLMYFPLPGVYLANAADYTTFTVTTEDIDGLTPNNAGAPMDFSLYYSTENGPYGVGCNLCSTPHGANFYHPWENPILSGGTDSAFFYEATSWFSPAGQADNWIIMGPVTLPAGATVKWTDRTNPAYRDGYKVYISNTVSATPTFTDFTGAAIYTKTDSYPSTTYTTDTTWVQRSAGVPAMYSAQPIYIAFNHNANDMDVLYLDEFLVVESTAGVQEFVNGAKLFQGMPNPTNGISTINYELQNNSQVALNVYDVTGKVVATENMGNQTAGGHTAKFDASNLSAGVYYYSLTVDNATTASMKMVVIK